MRAVYKPIAIGLRQFLYVYFSRCRDIGDRSFFMGRGGGGFWGGGGIREFSSLKGGAIPKVEGGRGFLQVNVLV